MSTMDDPLAAMAAQLDDIEVVDVVNVRILPAERLLLRIEEVTEELRDRGEQLDPRSDRGRELHSERAALVIEKHRRIKRGDLSEDRVGE